MDATKIKAIQNLEASEFFYDGRYADGYMEEWPDSKKQRIRELLLSLDLPDSGSVLDFGCGNGVLTEVLGQTLPTWTVYGTDVSSVAISNAKQRYPKRTFFLRDGTEYETIKFDLVVSHHVLEHVYDIAMALEEINHYLNPRAAMFHILPCGNRGSFSHRLAALQVGGIDPRMGNRFFFEDEGHVRRMSTGELASQCAQIGFALKSEFYSGQHYGSIDYFTKYERGVIPLMSDWRRGVTARAKCEIFWISLYLRGIAACRKFVDVHEGTWKQRRNIRASRMFLGLVAPAYLIASGVDRFIAASAAKEWNTQRFNRNAGEMFLYFVRDGGVEFD